MKKEQEENQANQVDNSLKLIAKTSLIVFIGVIFSKVLAYVYRIIIARQFGPEVYGVFSLAIMIGGWFAAFSALGLSDGISRYIPIYRGKKETEKIRYIFRFSVIVLFISSIIAGIILFFASDFIAVQFFKNAKLSFFLKIFAVIVPINVLAYPFLSALRAYEKINWYSFIFNIAQNFAKVLFLIILILVGLGSSSIAFSYLLGMAAMLVLAYFVCKYKLAEIFSKSNIEQSEKKKIKKDLINYSIPLLFSGFISVLFYWIDSFSIGLFKGAFEVGIYNAAVPLAMALAVIPELFNQLFFPLITKEYSKDNLELIKTLSKQVSKWVFIIVLPIFILLFLFPGAAINLLFGQDYLPAINALRILSIGALISAVFMVSSQLISMIGKSRLVLFNIVLASAINFVLNMIFIPMQKIWFIDNAIGINGAALATLISVIVLNLLFVFEAKHYLKVIPLRRKMVNIFLLSIIPTALLLYFRTKFEMTLPLLVVLSGLFVIVYLALIVVSRSFDKNDWMIIKAIFLKAKSISQMKLNKAI
ncbi:MAG: flippase [Candidatus Pacearchaeota archaeon]|jgi:O-antigen/teichoic acid export membrane protein